jgi:ribonuclease T1
VRLAAALWALLFLAAALAGEIRVSELPAEAHDTLQLIRKGGPYPYPQDGHAFHNRERLLPPRSAGYYAEFTVKTPGARGRGARRIVAGRGGELYYTADHYGSFRRIMLE